jgi:hypothetical protein
VNHRAQQTRDVQRSDDERDRRDGAGEALAADETRAEPNDDPGQREAFRQPQHRDPVEFVHAVNGC